MKTIEVEIDDGEEAQFTALVKAFRGGWLKAPAVDLPEGLHYQEMVCEVQRDPAASFKLKQRLAEDEDRDPLDALADAEMLNALAVKRFGEIATYEAGGDRRTEVAGGAAAALQRLFELAEGNADKSGRIARFLCGLYNGRRFPFDLTLFRGLDQRLFDDCLTVLQMDFLERQEVQTFFPNGVWKWELMAQNWCVIDVEKVMAIAKSIAERAVEIPQLAEAAKELVAELNGGLQQG